MNRSNAGARLSAYLEGDLSESERSKLESRLADDPALRATLREIESVVGLIRDLPEPELPSAFSSRVLARVQEQGEQAPGGVRGWIQRLVEPAMAVPLAAGVTALALFIGSQQEIAPPLDASGGSSLQAAAMEQQTPATSRRVAAAPGSAPTELASTSPDTGSMTLTEIQRHTLQTILSRYPHGDLARQLRGSGHPHAASFVNHVVETGPNLQVVSFETRRARR